MATSFYPDGSIQITRGDSVSFALTLTQADKVTPFDYTGYTLSLTVVAYPNTPAILNCTATNGRLLATDPTNGITTLTLLPADTEALVPERYIYELIFVNNATNYQDTLLKSTFVVQGDIGNTVTLPSGVVTAIGPAGPPGPAGPAGSGSSGDPPTVVSFTTTDVTTQHQVFDLTMANNTYKLFSMTTIVTDPNDPTNFVYTPNGCFSLTCSNSGQVSINGNDISTFPSQVFQTTAMQWFETPFLFTQPSQLNEWGGAILNPPAATHLITAAVLNHIELNVVGANADPVHWTFVLTEVNELSGPIGQTLIGPTGPAGAVSYIRQLAPVTLQVPGLTEVPTGIIVPLSDYPRFSIMAACSGNQGTDVIVFYGMISTEGTPYASLSSPTGVGTYNANMTVSLVGSDVHISISSQSGDDMTMLLMPQILEASIVSGTIPVDPNTVVTFTTNDATTPHQVFDIIVPNNNFVAIAITAKVVNTTDPSDYVMIPGYMTAWADGVGAITMPAFGAIAGSSTAAYFQTLEGANTQLMLNGNSTSSGNIATANTVTYSSPSANHWVAKINGFNSTVYNWTFTWKVVT